jgi:hypothetical protein
MSTWGHLRKLAQVKDKVCSDVVNGHRCPDTAGPKNAKTRASLQRRRPQIETVPEISHLFVINRAKPLHGNNGSLPTRAAGADGARYPSRLD